MAPKTFSPQFKLFRACLCDALFLEDALLEALLLLVVAHDGVALHARLEAEVVAALLARPPRLHVHLAAAA